MTRQRGTLLPKPLALWNDQGLKTRTASRGYHPCPPFHAASGSSGNRFSRACPDLEAKFGAGVGASVQVLAAILTLPVVRSDQAIVETRRRRGRARGRRKAAQEGIADQNQGGLGPGARDRLLGCRAPNADAVKTENLDELSLAQRRPGVPQRHARLDQGIGGALDLESGPLSGGCSEHDREVPHGEMCCTLPALCLSRRHCREGQDGRQDQGKKRIRMSHDGPPVHGNGNTPISV